MPSGIYIRTKEILNKLRKIHGGNKYHLGYHHSEESKRKMGLANIGKSHSMSKEGKKRLSLLHRGKPLSQEHRKKLSEAHIGKQCNENNPLWKGEKATRAPKHVWVYRHKGKPQTCVNCGATCKERKLNWANVNHKYHRNLDDYISLCIFCHRQYDINNNGYKNIKPKII